MQMLNSLLFPLFFITRICIYLAIFISENSKLRTPNLSTDINSNTYFRLRFGLSNLNVLKDLCGVGELSALKLIAY